jgi:hypothetical protein
MKTMRCTSGWAWGLVAAAILLRLYLYVMGGLYIPVTTDEALTVLQAKDVLRGEFPLLLTAQPYMFPLEAYWMVPLLWLPRTAFGLRALVAMEGAAFLALALLVLRSMGKLRDVWPGAILALFPSVYLVMNQFSYSQPHYNSAFILSLAALAFVLSLRDDAPPRRLFALALGGGFFAALAFSNAMLSVALVLPVAIAAPFRTSFRRWPAVLPGLAIGAAAGLLPFAAGLLLHPGAHQSVSATYSWGHALERLWSPALKYTLPVTFGFTPCLFPDSREKLALGDWINPWFPHLFSLFLAALLAVCLIRLFRGLVRERRLILGDAEIAFGVSLLSLILFALSKRANSTAYRYLAPVLVVFPFGVAALYRALPRFGRPVLAAVAAVLALYNAAAGILLPSSWRDPSFAAEVVSAPDLEPAIRILEEKGIRHCVASHWAAYRINFYTDEEILCSQPFNERFPGWFLPYKDDVDASTNVAYVLTEKIRFLKPSIFERHMRTMGVEANVTTAGHFRVYADFRLIDPSPWEPVPRGELSLSASHNPADLDRLLDRDTGTWWTTKHLQETNMWLQIDLDRPAPLKELVLHYSFHPHDRLKAIRVRARGDDRWHTVHESFSAKMDKFAFRNGQPVYGESRRTIPLDGRVVDAVRLEAAEVRDRFAWTLTEVEARRLAE